MADEEADITAAVLVVIVVIILVAIGMCLQFLLQTSKYMPTIWARPSTMQMLQEFWTSIAGKDTPPIIFLLHHIYEHIPAASLDFMPPKRIFDVMLNFWSSKYDRYATAAPEGIVVDSAFKTLGDMFQEKTKDRTCAMLSYYMNR